ncbi:uncharacterized protein CBL_02854 [Carabus blaptoides fortunei]
MRAASSCDEDVVGTLNWVVDVFGSSVRVFGGSVLRRDAFLTSILMCISRFGINVAYNSGAQYAVELIPTEVRGQGVSTIHVAGYVASFFSPQILYLNIYWKPLPELVLGTLLVVGAMACLKLPETLNKTLPVTLEDGEAFGEDENLCDFSCCAKNRSNSQQTLVPKQQCLSMK